VIGVILRLLASLVLGLSALSAQAEANEFRLFKSGEPLNLRPDRAYLLMRLDTDFSKFDIDLLRVPEAAEIAAYEAEKRKAYDAELAKAKTKLAKNPKDKSVERLGKYDDFRFAYGGRPNLFAMRSNKALVMVSKIAVVLAEVPPADYVVYAQGYSEFLYQCYCLGTVGFTAKPGEITDLGTAFFAKAWEPSPIPELAGEVDLGRSAVMDYGLFAAAIRPARPGDAIPAGLDAGRVKPAGFRAVGPFVETNVVLINRLAAMPGVLAYDGGKVIDVSTGKELPPN
jgi:hypothetical protein